MATQATLDNIGKKYLDTEGVALLKEKIQAMINALDSASSEELEEAINNLKSELAVDLTQPGGSMTITLQQGGSAVKTIRIDNVANATNATNATKATQDGNGNVIVDTYATKSGAKVDFTIDDNKIVSLTQGGDNVENDVKLAGVSYVQAYVHQHENNTIDYLDENFVNNTKLGVANGVATLDTSGKVPSSQLPSYVDDVIEYASLSALQTANPKDTGVIYVTTDNNKVYRYSGTGYVEISSSLALGETSSTAYAGNKGKANRSDIDAIIAGSKVVGKATNATNAESASSANTASQVAHTLRFSKLGDGSEASFNGSADRIISYNSVGAVPVTFTSSSGVTYSVTVGENGIYIEGSNNVIHIGTNGIALESADNTFITVNGEGIFYNDNQLIDESMTLTPDDIEAIWKD